MKKIFLSTILIFCILTFQNLATAIAEIPSLSLNDSLPLAEAALTEKKINITNYYLYSVTYSNSSKGSYWYYAYRPKTESSSNQIYLKVYMNKEVEISETGQSRRR